MTIFKDIFYINKKLDEILLIVLEIHNCIWRKVVSTLVWTYLFSSSIYSIAIYRKSLISSEFILLAGIYQK